MGDELILGGAILLGVWAVLIVGAFILVSEGYLKRWWEYIRDGLVSIGRFFRLLFAKPHGRHNPKTRRPIAQGGVVRIWDSDDSVYTELHSGFIIRDEDFRLTPEQVTEIRRRSRSMMDWLNPPEDER